MFKICYLDRVFLVLLRTLSEREKKEVSAMLDEILKGRTYANDNTKIKNRDFLVD